MVKGVATSSGTAEETSNSPNQVTTINYVVKAVKNSDSSDDEQTYVPRKKPMTCYEKWSLAVTVIGVVVAIGVLIVYAGQLRAMRASVVAAEKAAGAVNSQTQTLKDTALRQLRAYICVDAASLVFIRPYAPDGVVTIKNCGQTPAYKVRHW